LPDLENFIVKKQGSLMWLQITDHDVNMIWEKLKNYLKTNKISIVESNKLIGVLQTDWIENNESLPQGVIGNILKKAGLSKILTYPQQDSFRFRFEKNSDNTTKLFVTHRSIRSKQANPEKFGSEIITNWEILEPNPQIELEMLNTLKYYLAGFKKIDKNLVNEPVADLESDFKMEISKSNSNDLVLVFENEFDFVWDKLLQYIDRNQYEILSKDISTGQLSIRLSERRESSKSLLSSIMFWKKKKADTFDTVLIFYLMNIDDSVQLRVIDEAGVIEKNKLESLLLEVKNHFMN
jgi:outer membrane protein assembly factor BamC